MSNKIFPSFQGWSYDKTKTPVWSTDIQKSRSGKETRSQNYSYPLYEISIKYNFLTDNAIKSNCLDKGELEKLQGFFNSVGGSFDDFLYLDDVENSVTDQVFGKGDGITKTFQLIRSLPDWNEPIFGLIDAPQIKINDVLTSAFTFTPKGLITFDVAPAANSVLKWSGQYLFRVRFQNDTLQLTRTYDGLYEGIEIPLITVK